METPARQRNRLSAAPPAARRAFSLLEVMVAVAIVVALAALALPVLDAARLRAARSACLGHLRQIGTGIALYAAENDGRIPFGPKAGPFTNPANLYPSTGAPTSLVSLSTGAPVALGLTLHYLDNPRVLFCPGSDQPVDAIAELAKVGRRQAQCSYYYRHAGNTQLFDSPGTNLDPPNIRLANLGLNRRGLPVRALVVDSMFLCPESFGTYGVVPRTHHRRQFANVLYADGHASSHDNRDERFSVDVRAGGVTESFSKILDVFEQADAEN